MLHKASRWLRAGIIALVLIDACHTEHPSRAHLAQRVAAAAGCYELESLVSHRPEGGPLGRYRLLAESVGVQMPRLRRLELLTTGDSFDDRFQAFRLWRMDSLSDTIHVQAGDGFTAQFFRGVPTAGGDWSGVAGTAGDAGPPFEHGVHPARSRRIECPRVGIFKPPPNDR